MQRAVRYLEISPLSLDDKMEGDPNAGPFMKYRRAKMPKVKTRFLYDTTLSPPYRSCLRILETKHTKIRRPSRAS